MVWIESKRKRIILTGSYMEEVTFDQGFEYSENLDKQKGQGRRYCNLEGIVNIVSSPAPTIDKRKVK